MRFYFVDYENTGVKGLEGIRSLSEDDKVFIFFGKDSKISVKTLLKLNKVRPTVEFFESVDCFKNANDFQIFAKIGVLVGNGSLQKGCIISCDKCFTMADKFFSSNGSTNFENVFTAANIKESLSFNWEKSDKPKQTKNSQERVMDLLKKRIKLKSLEGKERELCAVIESSKELKDLHNSLVKIFGRETGQDLYQQLKAHFNELKIAT